MTPEQIQALFEAERGLTENKFWLDYYNNYQGTGLQDYEPKRAAAMAQFESNFGKNRTDDKIRQMTVDEAYRLMNGGGDANLQDLQTKYTAQVPWQASEMNSAQAAQMANNGLSGSGLANRAARQSRLSENEAWNSGMDRAKGEYRDSAVANRSLAAKMYLEAGDNEGQLAAEQAIKRANRLNEKSSTKSGAQGAYEFIGGIRNGMSGDNGVF